MRPPPAALEDQHPTRSNRKIDPSLSSEILLIMLIVIIIVIVVSHRRKAPSLRGSFFALECSRSLQMRTGYLFSPSGSRLEKKATQTCEWQATICKSASGKLSKSSCAVSSALATRLERISIGGPKGLFADHIRTRIISTGWASASFH